MTTHEPQQPEPGGVPPQPATPPAGYGDPAVSPPDFSPPVSGDPAHPLVGDPAYPPPPEYGPPAGAGPAYAPPGEPGVGQSGFGQPGVGVPPSPPAPGYNRPGLQGFNPQAVNPLDWGIIAAGVVALIFSTFGFYTYKVSFSGFSQSDSVSGWHGGLAPIAVLLALAAAALLAVEVLGVARLTFPVRLVVLAAFALASLLLLLALFVVPGNTGGAGALGISVNKGHGIGYWITLLAVLAGTALAAKRFTDTGGKLPARG
jgi:hypothetical protein